MDNNMAQHRCTDINETNVVLQLPRETGTVKLSCDLSISAIIELGQLYKKLHDGEWTYGNLERFVENNFINFMEFWDWNSDTDTDLGVEFWWETIGKFRKINKKMLDKNNWEKILGVEVTSKDVALLNDKFGGIYSYTEIWNSENYTVYKDVESYVADYYTEKEELLMITQSLGYIFKTNKDKALSVKDIVESVLLNDYSFFLENGQIVDFSY